MRALPAGLLCSDYRVLPAVQADPATQALGAGGSQGVSTTLRRDGQKGTVVDMDKDRDKANVYS